MPADTLPSRRARSIDPAAFAGVVPGTYYRPGFTGGLFARSGQTAVKWCRAGKLPGCRPDPIDPRRFLIPGSAILALAADLVLTSAPAPSETEREREARARASLDEALKLAKRKPGKAAAG